MLQAHILNNTNEVIPYLFAPKVIVKDNNLRQSKKWLLMEYNRIFIHWFKAKVLKDSKSSETLM